MTFDDAMYEVLQHRRYDLLTGRRTDIVREISQWLGERLIDALIWLLEQINLGDLAGDLGDDIALIAGIFAGIGTFVLILAAFVIVRAIWRLQREEKYDLSDIFEELAQGNYTVPELLQLSDSAADRRIAVRYRYIAALLSLNEREIIHISPAATNRLILQQIRQEASELVEPFRVVADVFHLSWFGHKELVSEMFIQFTQAVDILVEGEK